MRQINLSKSTKMFKIPRTQKRKREFSLHVFGSYFIGRGFAYRAKR